ncbi:thiamine phosphate synthase [Taibaiella soli]|uniref:Thiamine-phosphate synthase n=1 Tax=Taibaiella soli TaxID=1649169 RepID=A0A2W2BCS9_9BACT|nr:thiamine phosphate synthase [Taibaiella soli]PZF71466.1 thiamine phosphate synthase [Taibaiella soli]
MKKISRLQYITTDASLAEKACIGGAKWIQLRLKNVNYEAYLETAKEVQLVCEQYNAIFIVNDNVSLALETGAHGVHLGKEDMPPAKARDLLGDDFIIGSTANTIEDIIRLSKEPINYIGLGPFRFTKTKENLSPVIGLEGYEAIFAALNKQNIQHPPIVGIGGIETDDIAALLQTGLYGIAVSGIISNAEDPAMITNTLLDAVYHTQLQTYE